MRTIDEIAIIDSLEKMKETTFFSTFITAQNEVLEDEQLLAIIDTYREAKGDYMAAVVAKEHPQLVEMKKQALVDAKAEFDTEEILRDYYRSLRKVELFVDDLNYEIGQILAMKKAGCGH